MHKTICLEFMFPGNNGNDESPQRAVIQITASDWGLTEAAQNVINTMLDALKALPNTQRLILIADLITQAAGRVPPSGHDVREIPSKAYGAGWDTIDANRHALDPNNKGNNIGRATINLLNPNQEPQNADEVICI